MPKILVVDDLEENIYAVSKTLRFHDYDVITAQNGLEALDKVRLENPDLVIMDIQMPLMDGHEACKRIKTAEETRHIPVIFLTARFPEINDKVRGLDIGADDYLTKPFHQSELVSKVKALLRIKELYDRLSDSQKRLKEYSEHLEEMVEERTAELKAAQVRLVQSERLSAIGRLAAEIAHEVNNPLAIIKNYLRLISDDMTESDPYRENISIIGGEVERIAKIVRDLLSFSKPPLSLEPVNLHEEINRIAALYKDTFSKKRIVVSEDLIAANPVAKIDPDGIRQVMINIVNNAMDAMPDGGKLTISTGSEECRVSLRISDTGCGISQESKGNVFEPFFTTKTKGGTGLGLYISYGIVKAFKGDIEVESEVGKGTTFTITLPVTATC